MNDKTCNVSSWTRVIALLLFFATAAAQAAMYKWTDADGIVHYSEHPPTGMSAEVIKAPSRVDSESALKALRQETIRANKLEQAREKAAAERKKRAEYLAVKEDNCRKAQTRLDHLKNTRRIRAVDAEGNVTRTSEEEHQARIAAVAAKVDKWCN
ncbi:MAG: DUF4124 domain-containing protein [Gammaproteobacteria bacterium]